jgi:putative cell wall-binding protein
MRRLGSLLALIALLLLGLPAGASVAQPAGSGWDGLFGGSDGTLTGTGTGPAAPGVRWVRTIEDSNTSGSWEGFETKDFVVLDAAGNLLVRGHYGITPGTGKLTAVRPGDGSTAYTLDGAPTTCVPGIAPDGTSWVLLDAEEGPIGGPFELRGVDTTGATVASYTQPTNTPGQPRLKPCGSGIRFLSDGTAVMIERSFDSPNGGVWLRVVATGAAPAQRWIEPIEPDVNQTGRWLLDVRVGPPGAPNADTIYTFHQPPTGLVIQARRAGDGTVRGSVAVPGRSFLGGAIVLDGSGRIFLSTRVREGSLAGHLVAVHDPGTGDPTVLWSHEMRVGDPATAYRAEMSFLALGDGDTLVGTYSGYSGQDGIVGVDAATGLPRWEHRFGIIGRSLAADATGTAYFMDSFTPRLVAVAPSGTIRWTLPYGDDSGGLPSGAWRLAAVGATGDVYLTGSPAFTPLKLAAVTQGTPTDRRAGVNRLETAVAVSQASHPVDGTVEWVVLARSDQYPDALAGAPLAHRLGGPLLLTPPSRLAPETATELRRLGTRRVVMLGGQAALSPQVVADLVALGVPADNIERVSGPNRFATAGMVADRVGGTQAVLVEGANADPARGWPDAVAASGFAALTGRPILLLERDRLPPDTDAALRRLGVTRGIVVGGPAAVSDDNVARIAAVTGSPVERLSGPSRYATSVAVATRSLEEGARLASLWVATGTAFADALTAGPAAAAAGGVLLLVDGRNAAGGQASYDFLAARAAQVGAVNLVGGPSAISVEVEARIRQTIGRG